MVRGTMIAIAASLALAQSADAQQTLEQIVEAGNPAAVAMLLDRRHREIWLAAAAGALLIIAGLHLLQGRRPRVGVASGAGRSGGAVR